MWRTRSRLRVVAIFIMFIIAGVGTFALYNPSALALTSSGPIQSGHAGITCTSCHQASPGTTRQQIQAKLFYAVGKRQTPVDFGYAPVASAQCLDCHERPNERHPIYRFNEPRFSEARSEIAANSCLGCHSEHQNQRVSVSETVCSSCHGDLVLKSDPLDISHLQLVADQNWGSCLGCHDFHGNHAHKPQTILAEAFDVQVIRDYLANGADPYGTPKLYEAKTNE